MFWSKNRLQYYMLLAVADNNLELTLDTRTGGNGVQLGNRKLNAAEIVTTKNEDNENVFATVRRFCKQMCDKPRIAATARLWNQRLVFCLWK